MAAVPRRVLVDALAARATIPNVTVYKRLVAPAPPTISANDLRVKPYVVLHPSAGVTGPDERLGGDRVGLAETFQLSCVAGEEKALDLLVDAITARFDEWRPALAAPYDVVVLGRCRMLNDPGPSRRDDDVAPPRFWTPLIYGLVVNN
jgi:hypothetical protein